MDDSLDFKHVMLMPTDTSHVSSRNDVLINSQFNLNDRTTDTINLVPVVASNMEGVGEISVAEVLDDMSMFTVLKKSLSVEEILSTVRTTPRAIPSFGIVESELNRFQELRPNLKYVCFDIANGHLDVFASTMDQISRQNPKLTIIAGNVANPESVINLYDAGVSIVKIGIGSGAACATTDMTGVGYPQFSLIQDCSRERDKRYPSRYLMSDGGCRVYGDIMKALVAGADFVMLGKLLAGHKEGGILSEGNSIPFSGSSSREAYTIKVAPKGSILETVDEIKYSLRSACTYLGVLHLNNIRFQHVKVLKVAS